MRWKLLPDVHQFFSYFIKVHVRFLFVHLECAFSCGGDDSLLHGMLQKQNTHLLHPYMSLTSLSISEWKMWPYVPLLIVHGDNMYIQTFRKNTKNNPLRMSQISTPHVPVGVLTFSLDKHFSCKKYWVVFCFVFVFVFLIILRCLLWCPQENSSCLKTDPCLGIFLLNTLILEYSLSLSPPRLLNTHPRFTSYIV